MFKNGKIDLVYRRDVDKVSTLLDVISIIALDRIRMSSIN
jgi:hypothetical protein